jgi:serine/threonine protein kinase
VKGTLGFMPPEQMFNRQLTVASDLYSLGATLICLLIGINSTEIGSLMDDTGPINFKNRLPQLTPEFLEWLQKMVEPNFKHRYPSADAALNALIPLEVVQQRNKSKLALISVGLLTAIAAIFIPLLWKSPEPQTAVDLKPVINAKKLNPQTQVMLTDELESRTTREVWSLKQKKKVYFSVSAAKLRSRDRSGKWQQSLLSYRYPFLCKQILRPCRISRYSYHKVGRSRSRFQIVLLRADSARFERAPLTMRSCNYSHLSVLEVPDPICHTDIIFQGNR